MKTRSRIATTIDRDLYLALEAMEQVAARQQAEIERLRKIIELDEIMLKSWCENGCAPRLTEEQLNWVSS